MPTKTIIHGFPVIYEENAKEGVIYLRDDLDYQETKVFFDQARQKGEIRFEDDKDHQYTLSYKGGVYHLIRR